MKKIPYADISEFDWEPYVPSYFFAMCSSDNQQITEFHECRECIVHELIMCHINSLYSRSDIDINKTRLLVGRMPENGDDGLVEKEILRGLKIVHHFEEIAGWPKSRIYRTHKSKFVYLFRGHKNWQRSPYSISLYLLLIRLGRHEEFQEFKTHTQFSRAWGVVYQKRLVDTFLGLENHIHDCKFLNRKMLRRSVLLVKRHKEFFGKRSTCSLFSNVFSQDEGYIGDGIHNLCNLKTQDSAANLRFKRLCNKYSV